MQELHMTQEYHLLKSPPSGELLQEAAALREKILHSHTIHDSYHIHKRTAGIRLTQEIAREHTERSFNIISCCGLNPLHDLVYIVNALPVFVEHIHIQGFLLEDLRKYIPSARRLSEMYSKFTKRVTTYELILDSMANAAHYFNPERPTHLFNIDNEQIEKDHTIAEIQEMIHVTAAKQFWVRKARSGTISRGGRSPTKEIAAFLSVVPRQKPEAIQGENSQVCVAYTATGKTGCHHGPAIFIAQQRFVRT